jgi:predicted RNA-binding Zn-ribbon protein involved in translation (DUF1610 family)
MQHCARSQNASLSRCSAVFAFSRFRSSEFRQHIEPSAFCALRAFELKTPMRRSFVRGVDSTIAAAVLCISRRFCSKKLDRSARRLLSTGGSMKDYHCPHCGQSTFTTLCTDCQAEGIRIDETRSIFHLGRCLRCGHVDDEPCAARLGSRASSAAAWKRRRVALKSFTRIAFRFATRAAEAIRPR